MVVPTEFLAELPEGISFAQAATLPVAGLTALRALEIGGFVLGKRVLVTGASGGVGRFAIQLAALAGAHVTAARAHAHRGGRPASARRPRGGGPRRPPDRPDRVLERGGLR